MMFRCVCVHVRNELHVCVYNGLCVCACVMNCVCVCGTSWGLWTHPGLDDLDAAAL